MDCVTGAYSYTGRFVAQALLDAGRELRTLTNHVRPDALPGAELEARPLRFERGELVASLAGVDVLYNTYWVRFNAMGARFESALANIATLLQAARDARVRRVVHVSVSNCHADDRLAYYRGKAEAEQLVRDSGLEYAIVRPTLIYADGDILLNNIAWLMRHLPVFGIPGDGSYRLQPVAGEDVGEICRWAGLEAASGTEVDAAGPEVYSYRELVELMAAAMHVRRPMWHIDRRLALAGVRLAGLAVHDIILTEEELAGLEEEKLLSLEEARGRRSFKAWLTQAGDRLGRRYASERRRHFRGG